MKELMEKDLWHGKLLEEDLNHERFREEWEEVSPLSWYVRKGGVMSDWFH